MKKHKFLLLAFMAVAAFQTCKTKENLTDINDKQTINNQTVSNDSVTVKGKNKVIAIGNNKDSTKTNKEKKIAENNGTNDTTITFVTITEPIYNDDPPLEAPINPPMPRIVTELFPDVKWKLYVNNMGFNRYYQTEVGNRIYGFNVLNDLVKLKYAPGKLSDKQLIELLIFLFLHPFDNQMKLISTEHLEKKYYRFNYKSIVILNGEEVEFYSLVQEHKISGYISYKNGKSYKEGHIR